MIDAYQQFLQRKVARSGAFGFEPPSPPHESLFGHQRDLGSWLCRGGRRACFANFGLGKTRINLQVAKWITESSGRYLIIAPLGVRQEFTLSDGPAMGMELEYVKTNAECKASAGRVAITNYERVRDGDIDVTQFDGVGLDEASVLRSYGSDTYQTFLRKFRNVKYKFVFVAEPLQGTDSLRRFSWRYGYGRSSDAILSARFSKGRQPYADAAHGRSLLAMAQFLGSLFTAPVRPWLFRRRL